MKNVIARKSSKTEVYRPKKSRRDHEVGGQLNVHLDVKWEDSEIEKRKEQIGFL